MAISDINDLLFMIATIKFPDLVLTLNVQNNILCYALVLRNN
jgi:hypothetical protein